MRVRIPVRAPIVAVNHRTIFFLSFLLFFLFSFFFFFLVRCVIKSLDVCDDDTVAIFFMLILETKWNGKKFVVLFQVKKVSALHERFHVHVFSYRI